MNERKLSNFCLLLLVFSMLLRLICATGADARMAESVPAAQTEPDEPAAPAALGCFLPVDFGKAFLEQRHAV